MFNELNTLLDINVKELLDEKMTLIVEDHSSDAGFLINHLISLYLKSDGNVCLVAMTQSFNHFNSVGTKLGVNLKQAKEEGRFTFIDCLTNIGNLLCNNTNIVNSDQLGLSRMSLHGLFTVITSACENMTHGKPSPTLILIDDLSVLNSLGFETKEISSFVQHLRYYCCTEDPSRRLGFTALIHRDNAEEDDDIDFLHRYMFHMTNLVLEVTGLQSGYCKDVHGELTVTSRNNSQSIPIGNKKKKMQFKIMDKNIKLFAVGTSSAVL